MSLQSLYVTYMLVIFLLCFILTLPQTGIARGIYTSHSHAVLLVLQFSRYTRAMGEYYPPPPLLLSLRYCTSLRQEGCWTVQ